MRPSNPWQPKTADERSRAPSAACEEIRELCDELSDDAVFDFDRLVPHLTSCPTCGVQYPEILLLLGLEPPRRAQPIPPPIIKRSTSRVAAALLAAGILISVSTWLVTVDTNSTIPGTHPAVSTAAPNQADPPQPERGIRLPLSTSTLWTQVSYFAGDKARSTLKSQITRPNSRIRATVTR